MTILFTIVHILVCFFLIVVVLLQSGKAADLAGAFGGQGSQTAFGPRGSATVLSKATTIAASVFMITSLSLAILATRNAGGTGSVLEKQKQAPKPVQTQSLPPGAKPTVTVTPEGGTPRTVPLNIPNAPGQTPAGQKPQQPQGKQQPAPTKK